MFRKCALSLAAMAAIGFSLAMSSPANAFFGGSNGVSVGSHGGSFGGLFHRHHGSSGSYGSHGGSSNSCGCDCGNSDEASEGNHEDNDEHHEGVSERHGRDMDAPSREVRRDANGVIIEGYDRDGRHHDDRNADHNRDGDKRHDKDMKKDEHKDKDKDKDNDKKDEAKK